MTESASSQHPAPPQTPAPPAGLVLGILAQRQIARTGEAGSGLALAGAIVGGVLTGVLVLFLIAWVGVFVSILATFLSVVPR